MTTYTIQPGDNLSKIARAHNTTVEELARLNNISDPNRINAGTTIKLFENTIPEEEITTQDVSQEEITAQLESMHEQLSQMQEQMGPIDNSLDGLDMLGLGLGTYGAYKIGEKALPYTWKGVKNVGQDLYLRGLYAKDGIINGAKKVSSNVGSQVKHIAKKAELEYAFGKNTLKQSASKVGKATVNATKTTAKVAAKGAKAAAKVGGKLIGKLAMPIGIAVDAVEVVDIYREQGVKAAAKSVAKKGACIAAGAAIGSVIPGVGTAVGAGIGWLVSAFV